MLVYVIIKAMRLPETPKGPSGHFPSGVQKWAAGFDPDRIQIHPACGSSGMFDLQELDVGSIRQSRDECTWPRGPQEADP